MTNSYQYWDRNTHNAIAPRDGDLRIRRHDADVVRLDINAPPPPWANTGNSSEDEHSDSADEHSNNDGIGDNHVVTENGQESGSNTSLKSSFQNQFAFLEASSTLESYKTLQNRMPLHVTQILRSVSVKEQEKLKALFKTKDKKRASSIVKQEKILQKKQKNRAMTQATQLSELKPVIQEMKQVRTYEDVQVVAGLLLYTIAKANLEHLLSPMDLESCYMREFGDDVKRFKKFQFPEYSNTWRYRSSRTSNLPNPFAFREKKKQLEDARKIGQQNGEYPSSSCEHTQRYKRIISELDEVEIEIYDDVCIQELHKQTNIAFRKKIQKLETTLPEDVSFERVMASKLCELPIHKRTCIGLDKNGYILYMVLKQAISVQEQEQVLEALYRILKSFPNQHPSAKDPRHKHVPRKDIYVHHMVDWCPQGHPNTRTASRQTIANGKVIAVNDIILLTKSLKSIRIEMSAVIEAIDPNLYQVLRTVVAEATPVYKQLLQACVEDVFLGTVWNTDCVAVHVDWKDAAYSLSGMNYVGTFAGGYLCLPQLGIKIRYTPDMMVLLATREVKHFISNFTGARFGMVHCCH